MLTLDKIPKLPDVPYKDDPQGVETSSNIQKIKILSPSDQGLFFLSNGNATIPLVWDAPADDINYRIYIWDVRDARTRPYASTDQSWYQLSVDKVGTYKIQLEDEKHRYRSDAISITVDRPMSDITSNEKMLPIALWSTSLFYRHTRDPPRSSNAAVLHNSFPGKIKFRLRRANSTV